MQESADEHLPWEVRQVLITGERAFENFRKACLATVALEDRKALDGEQLAHWLWPQLSNIETITPQGRCWRCGGPHLRMRCHAPASEQEQQGPQGRSLTEWRRSWPPVAPLEALAGKQLGLSVLHGRDTTSERNHTGGGTRSSMGARLPSTVGTYLASTAGTDGMESYPRPPGCQGRN